MSCLRGLRFRSPAQLQTASKMKNAPDCCSASLAVSAYYSAMCSSARGGGGGEDNVEPGGSFHVTEPFGSAFCQKYQRPLAGSRLDPQPDGTDGSASLSGSGSSD